MTISSTISSTISTSQCQQRRAARLSNAAAAGVQSPGWLHTPRLVLRPFRPEDWAGVHAYDADPEVLQYLGMAPRTAEGTRAFLAWTERARREKPRRYWPFAIVLRKEQQLIGGCCLRVAADIGGALDCGVELNRRYWDQGYGTEAVQALVGYGLQQLRAEQVVAECHPENVRSQRVLGRAGMAQVPFPPERKADLVREGLWNEDQFWSVAAATTAATAAD